MRRSGLIAGVALAALLIGAPALARGGFGGGGGFRGGGGGGWGGGGYHGGDGFGGDDMHGDSGWHDSAGGADWYHGANGGDYRPPQMTDTGYKPGAAYVPGNEYHPPAAAVGGDAYHPAGVAVGGNAYHPPMAATGYRYPGAVDGYPHGYWGYGYHPYAAWGAAGVVTAAAVVGIAAADTATWNAAYPYGPLFAYPYAYGYTAPMVYTLNCGGLSQPICATPTQMWSQSYANTAAAGDAIMAAALAAN